jgi:hypothetical protein
VQAGPGSPVSVGHVTDSGMGWGWVQTIQKVQMITLQALVPPRTSDAMAGSRFRIVLLRRRNFRFSGFIAFLRL